MTPQDSSRSCRHWEAIPLPTLYQSFLQRGFQEDLQNDRHSCIECKDYVPLKDLWVCIYCAANGSAAREALLCGKNVQKHSEKHSSEHPLAMNLESREIWCYECNTDVPDYSGDASSLKPAQCLPQRIRACLDGENPLKTEDEVLETDNTVDVLEHYANPQGGQIGLANLGNTCFFNSSVQALMHCPPMIGYFLTMKHSPIDEKTHPRQILANEVSTLMLKCWSGRYSVCVPNAMLRAVLMINPYFRGYGQHDAQELLRCLLDSLHEGLQIRCEYDYLKPHSNDTREVSPAATANDGHMNGHAKRTDEKVKPRPYHEPASIISDIFQGIRLPRDLPNFVDSDNSQHMQSTHLHVVTFSFS